MTIKERLVSDHLEIIAFAAKIKPGSKTKIAEGATIDALENSSEKIIRVSELGGTPINQRQDLCSTKKQNVCYSCFSRWEDFGNELGQSQ